MPITRKRTDNTKVGITDNKRRFIRSVSPKDSFTEETKSFEQGKIYQAGILPNEYSQNTQLARVPELYFVDPYPKNYKARLGNAYSFDYAIRGAVNTLIHYVLGREIKSTVYPITRDTLHNHQEVQEALNNAGLNEEEVKKLQGFLDTVDEVCELKRQLRGAMAQSYVYGRSALWIKRASNQIEDYQDLVKVGYKEGVPTDLKLLNSFYLGQVWVDENTWEPKKVTYDNGGIFGKDSYGKPLKSYDMPIENLIYFPREDYHITPNNLNYGLSALQTILPVSEVNRRLNERVFPEINTSHWAGSGIVQFKGLNQGDMDAFVNEMMSPGNWKATNQTFDLHQYKLQIAGNFLLDQRDKNIRQELMQLRVPSFLMNFEDVTNRATTELVATVWQETVLEAERDWLREILWKYWYRPLVELYFPEKEFLYVRAKVILEFQSIDFSSLIEKAVAVTNLIAANVISIKEGREMLKLPPFPEDQSEQIDKATQILKDNPDLLQQIKDQGKADLSREQAFADQTGVDNPEKKKLTGVRLSKSVAEGNISGKILQQAKNKARSAFK